MEYPFSDILSRLLSRLRTRNTHLWERAWLCARPRRSWNYEHHDFPWWLCASACSQESNVGQAVPDAIWHPKNNGHNVYSKRALQRTSTLRASRQAGRSCWPGTVSVDENDSRQAQPGLRHLWFAWTCV